MRKLAMFLMIGSVLVAPARAEGETFVDDGSALVVRMPAGWSQDHGREHGRVRFAGIYEIVPRQYALFSVETGPAEGFRGPAWLVAEEAHARATLDRVVTPFQTDPAFELGGKPASFYAVSGQGPGYDVRIRAGALVHEGRLYRVCEHSYNGAHEVAGKELDRIWKGVSFKEEGADAFQDEGYDDSGEEDAGDSGEAGPLDLTPDEDAKAEKVEDKVGNFKLELPPGWNVTHEPQDQADVQRRLVAVRATANVGEVMTLLVFRWTTPRAETFTIDTPSDVLQRLREDDKFFEQFYGAGSARSILPDVDGSVLLGECDKSASFVFRGITMQEEEKISKAQKLRNRGDKTVKVPVYKPIIVRGRLAMLSPHVYFAVGLPRRDVGEHEGLTAEFKKVLDSWKFLVEEEKPPPLRVGPNIVEDTTADPANAKDRKQTKIYSERGSRKMYKLQLTFVLPAGFVRMEKLEGANLSLLLAAQDASNNWVSIHLFNQSWQAMSEHRMEPVSRNAKLEEWKSNWEGKARGTNVPSRGQKFSLGKIRGVGYKKMEGTVEKFRGTFTAVVQDKSGFRTSLEVETRGDGDKVFESGIKTFLKSLKVKPVK